MPSEPEAENLGAAVEPFEEQQMELEEVEVEAACSPLAFEHVALVFVPR